MIVIPQYTQQKLEHPPRIYRIYRIYRIVAIDRERTDATHFTLLMLEVPKDGDSH